MFTWNFQYISKTRLAETFHQLMLDSQKGDILIRIHTAIHLREEAVELAKFVKNLVPGAIIFGTSTSAVISWGKLSQNQCVISVMQMSEGHVKSAMIPVYEDDGLTLMRSDLLCQRMKETVTEKNTKFILTFLTRNFQDGQTFVEKCNDFFPGVQLTGGIACASAISVDSRERTGFVFNENGWSDKAILVAALSGEKLECYSGCASGVQAIGEELTITDAFENCILSIDGRDAKVELGFENEEEQSTDPEMLRLFPCVYSDAENVPVMISLAEADGHQRLIANHNVSIGKKLRKAFIYDSKIITDNRALFRHVESFEKAETIFGYSCVDRSLLYSNCVKWELSAYENSNICGCLTDGEIAYCNGKNVFANCTFVVSAMGEEEYAQAYNPYVFSHTDSLAADNRALLRYLTEMEEKLAKVQKTKAADNLKAFVRDCELKLLYSEKEDLPNESALIMDMKIRGYDRICLINIMDTNSLRAIFSEQMIDLTYRNYLSKCQNFARKWNFRLYVLGQWQIAIGVPSYMVSLTDFVEKMEMLQKELFKAGDEFIAIVPVFCVINGCSEENIKLVYSNASVEMRNKNTQFYVCDAETYQPDEESIREKYHMVNVINYALEHDKVIPYFQGIHDNKSEKIHHYESLMRLEDENGTIYYPNSFLGVARSFGLLYDALSMVMVRKVFEAFRCLEGISVSINLGIRDIKNRELVEFIYDSLSVFPNPQNYIFEILENEDIEDYDLLVEFVDKIHELGGQISIDDFGSGYSNLQHILNIHSDFIKIDGSIVRNCCDNVESENLIALITGWKDLSKRDIKIVAEFVENDEIQKKLTRYGVDYSQGYLFSKPKATL